MKDCELCGSKARMHCESDQASLCWDCDSKVHGANFLVAKHSRSLLCQVCHSPTPWKASGPRLTPTVSVCEACVRRSSGEAEAEAEEEDDDHEEEESHGFSDDDDEDDEEDEEDEEEDEENGENQVVPWSFSSSSPPNLDGASSSCEDAEVARFSDSKRSRVGNADLDSDDETTSCGSFRSRKRARHSEVNNGQSESSSSSSPSSRSAVIVAALERLQKDAAGGRRESPSETVLGIRKLSRDDQSR